MRTLAAAAVAMVALATPATAVTGNYQKDFEHDFVGLLVFYTEPDPVTGDPFSHRCTGSLVSPTVVVTAGHCTEGVDHGRIYFEQAAAPNYDPDAFDGRGGDPTTGYPYQGGRTFSRADNFGFDSTGYPDTRDAGVVVLDEPYHPPSGDFGQLPAAGAVDAYADSRPKHDVRFRLSGYGDSDVTPRPVTLRERLTAMTRIVENSSPVTEFNLKTHANASHGMGGACHGDSGGPMFFDGTHVIAAVISFGRNAKCKGQDFSYRLDRPEVLTWITDPDRPDSG